MANVYKPGLIQIKPQYSQEARGETPENVTWWAYENTSPLSHSELVTLAGIFDLDFSSAWRHIAPNTATYVGAIYTDWSSSSAQVLSTVGTWTPTTGTATGALAPAQVAVLLNASVPTRYRGGHPRIYLPHVAASVMTNDHQIDPTVQSAVSEALFALNTDMATGFGSRFFFPAVYRFRSDAVKAQIVTIGPWTCVQEVATQRRRLRRVAHK